MDILFWLEPMAELHSPFLMKTWHRWFSHIDQQLAPTLTNYRSAVIAFESMRFYEGHGNFNKSLMLRHSDLRSNWSEKGNLSLKYEKDLSHSNEIELVDLIHRRMEGLNPDVVILLSEAPWLRRAFPDALFINIEVSWLHREPFPNLYSLDPVGKGKGRVLAHYADELLANFQVSDNERNIVNQVCGSAIQKLTANQRAKESIHAIRRNFRRIVLLPMSGRYVTDGETPVFAALEWFFEHRAEDRTFYVVTQHPMDKALSDSEVAFLKAKFGNLSTDLQEIGSQAIIPHVDAVIGDFSSVANQVLFFNKEMVSIRHELPYVDGSFVIRNPLCGMIARANSETKEQILCWLLTRYDTKKENVFNNGKWFATFLEAMKHYKETDSIPKFYQLSEHEGAHAYPRSRSNAERITSHKTAIRSIGKGGIKPIAFYLPQYHPIPENDSWWGKGFTEWTNVTRARPLFEGHYQPHRPADFGFYDLRVADVRKAQAELAKAYGIYGFCYYHYWFGGKLLLERPLQEMLKSGEPDFPFCLCWANENWTRTWDGGDQHILIAQNYSEEDDLRHIRHLSKIFTDPRYIRIHEKPLFLVYRANLLPNPQKTTTLWREEARRLGVGELYICRVESFADEHADPEKLGFDAAVEFQPDWTHLSEDLRDRRTPNLRAYHYEKVVDRMLSKPLPPYKRFQCVTPSWDNTPRRNSKSLFFTGASPAHYERWLTGTCSKLGASKAEERLVFINAWNEWGEGNHLEPDEKFGHGYLEATQRGIENAKSNLRKEAEAFHARIRSETMPNGKSRDTLAGLLELIEFHPDYVPAYLDLGAVFKQASDARNALAAYERACSLEPLNVTCLRCLADFYFVELKRNADAEVLYEKIVTLNPDDEEALLMLGNLATIQHRFEKALQAFLKVLVRNPAHEFAGRMFDELQARIKERSVASNPDLLLEEARVLAQRGRGDQAIHTLEKLLSSFPDHAAAHNDLGCLCYQTADNKKALAHYARAVALDRSNTIYRKNLADYYFIAEGELDKAVKLYLEVISADPKDAEALFALGVISETLGKCNDAVAFYRMVLSADPDHAAARERMESAARGNESIHAASDISLAASTSPKVSIIIVVFNKIEYTKKCIELAMQHARTVTYELILVDNASSDGTHEYLLSLSDTIKLIRNPANVGFTLACNQGARIASGEYILFLNNDTEPAAGWLDHLLALAEGDSKIGVVGSKLVFPDGKLQEAGGIIFNDGSGWNYGRHGDPDDPSFDFVREVDYVSGASLLVRRRLLKRLNYFDERYSPGYYEDTDLCFGARSLGYKVMYCPFSVVVHHEGISSGTDLKQGMKKYQAINREKFKAKWEAALRDQYPAGTRNVIQAGERGVSGNILIVDPFLPMFDRASGSLRLFTIISLLRKQGCHITFIARDGRRQEAYSAALRKMGVEVHATDGEMLRQMGHAVRKQILKARCYQWAILSFYDIAEQYLPIIRSASPETRILIDTVDIHFVRETRQAELNGDPAALRRAAATKKRELAIYSQADGVITVTERDWDHIRASLPSKPHFVIPNIHAVAPSSTDLNERKGLLFIGNFNHPPNTDAVMYFVDDIFPIIRQRVPDLTLTIVGNNPPKEVRALASSTILVTGYVPSTEPYLKTARVSIAPLRYGAGMKGKIGEAMAHGLPVVTTPIGAEGMGLVSGRNAFVAETPQEFADHVVELCTSDETWRSMADAARKVVYDTCSPRTVDLTIAEMLKQVALIPPLKGAAFKADVQAGPNKRMTKDLATIVILTFNQLKYTKECVRSIQQYTPEPHEIIFIDNGSTDGTVKWLKRLVDQHANYRLIENDGNLGFAKGCNQGIEAATGDHVVLLNNDVVVTRDWLPGLLECLHSAADIGIVGPMTNHISGPQKVPHVDYASAADLHAYAGLFRTQNRYRRIPSRRVVGFCMLFKRCLIDEIGLLDESFGSGNFEDDDLCLRACLSGYRNLIAGDVFIHHYGSRTFVGNKINYGSSLSRNRKVFQDKWRQLDNVKRFGKRLIIQNGIFHADEYFRKDDLEKATGSILDAIKQAPGERQLYIRLAQMLVEKKRFDDALGILASLPENNSDSEQYALMGYCHEALGNERSAEDYADRALAVQSASALALNVKGVLAFKRDDKAAAEAWFRRAIDSDPGFGESYTNLGSLKWGAGEQDEALAAFERGFILSPTIDDVATAYHTAIVATKSFDRAERVFREARALHPTHKRLAFLMIALLLQQEKLEPAMSEIEKAMLQFRIDDGILSAGLEVRKRIGALQIDSSKHKKATLSLCMIVKNEEAHLAKCLMSVKPVVDEMIVVDTGSSDRSKDIAAVLGARVFEYQWTNDFSEARTYSLAHACGDWILVRDGDEVISSLDYGLLQKITKQRPAKNRAYIMVTRNYTNNPGSRGWVANEGRYIEEEAGAGWVPSPKVRLFVNDQRVRFVNPVHELVEPTLTRLGIPIRTCDVPVHHYGRLNQNKLMAKGKEYYRLGIAKIEQTQGDCSAFKELAIQASEIGEYEEAVGVWQKVIERQPNDAVAHMNLGFALLMMRQHAKAAEFSKKALAIDPELREAALNYAAAEMFAGDIRTAVSTLEHLLEKHADYPPAMGRLAAAYIVSGRKAEGLGYLEKLNSRGFDCVSAWEEQALAFISEAKHEAAALLLAAAIEMGLGNGRLNHLLAECRSRTDGAVELCGSAHASRGSMREPGEPIGMSAGV